MVSFSYGVHATTTGFPNGINVNSGVLEIADGASTATLTGTLTHTGDSTIQSSTTSKPDITYTNTNADANSGSTTYQKNSASPTPNDNIWTHNWKADDSSGNADTHISIVVTQTDETTANEDATYDLDIITAGTAREYLGLGDAAVIINEDSQDIDTRIETDGNANMLFVDGGDNAVGIGKDPSSGVALDVSGDVAISQTLNVTLDVDVDGTGIFDALRLDIAPNASTATANYTVTININGTDYLMLLKSI